MDLARILRDAGLSVVTTPGWEQRGVRGAFAPVGVLNHHTAGHASAARPAPSVQLCVEGRPDLDGPLCHLVIGFDGQVHVIAAGRANHAGRAKASGPVPAGDGNTLYVGVEWDYAGTAPPPPAQFAAAVRVNAALLRHLGKPAAHARGHKETSVTGKWDPGHVDMDHFRAEIDRALNDRDGGIESMALDTKFRDWAGNEQTIQGWMDNVDRRLAALHHVMLVPGSEPSRIPGDSNRTNVRDAVMDVAAKVLGPGSEPPPAPWPQPIPDDTTPPPTPPAEQPPRTEPEPEPEVERRWTPERNVTAAGLAGAAGTVAAWIASLYGVVLPEPVSAAVVLLLTAVTAWLVPPQQWGQR